MTWNYTTVRKMKIHFQYLHLEGVRDFVFIFHWWLLAPPALLRPLLIVVVYLLSCVWLFCDPTGCSPPSSSAPGIFQVRVLEWAAIFFPNRSSQLIDWTHFSSIDRWILDHWAAWEALGRNKLFLLTFFHPSLSYT